MTQAVELTIDTLLDREKIRDCLYRYARGVDRADEAALRSAYWPDANDCHGSYNGPIDGFVDWARKVWAAKARNVHLISNILIEFDGSAPQPVLAQVESYFLALQRGPAPTGGEAQVMLAGRYCDRFEKRGAEWRIADRVVIYDWMDPQTAPDQDEATRFGPRQPIGAAFPDDVIYRWKQGGPA
ncbi:nuclear transport factor 2 family protein [Pseudooceanicola nitratireducens]|uniref:nuclear transport factor 2 family protein n=1 Tax=Pseudooceanicola nitratireducens TaxID=517719 RepID=UPI001C96FA87|nr:nuclear transport factor 2 family protein [Pseudooceanicola nitratireducens]MBY6166584.1 nuclear transport factor 2 family protein [Pseudooceanicola nitratireducens]